MHAARGVVRLRERKALPKANSKNESINYAAVILNRPFPPDGYVLQYVCNLNKV